MPSPIKHEDRTIAYQIITFVFVLLLVIFTVLVVATRFLFSKVMMENARDSVSHLSHVTTKEIDSRLEKIETISKAIQELYDSSLLTEATLDKYLISLTYELPIIESITFAFAPDNTGKPAGRTIIYKNNQATIIPLASSDFQYQDWFQIPQTLNRKFWTEPWFDKEGTEQTVISYCVPLYQVGKSIGILRVDTRLSDLQNVVSPLKLKKSGYAFLISNIGTIITHPADSLVMNESIFSIAEHYHDKQLRELGRSMTNGDVNFVQMTGETLFSNSWIYYSPLINNNWSLGIVITNTDVMRDLNLLLIIQTLISVIAFLTISITVYVRTLSVSRPLKEFSDLAAKIGQGDFDAPLPESNNTYEIDKLSHAVASMQSSLKEYIKNLEITSAEKNRILAEVKIASEIQKNLIPKTTEQVECKGLIRVSGVLEPAGVIGGDLYDYFPIGANHFGFAIADVAGKGIVAAMTMTIVSTFLRSVAEYQKSSHAILQDLNGFLCNHNIEANFVTVIMGVINLETGELEYSNAGHVPMFIRKMDRSYQKYADTHSGPVGVFENLKIGSSTVQLDIGDEIILFTDGITEAMNATEDFLGVEGFEQILKKLGAPNPKHTTAAILESVHTYSRKAVYKDDITILTVGYKYPLRRPNES